MGGGDEEFIPLVLSENLTKLCLITSCFPLDLVPGMLQL